MEWNPVCGRPPVRQVLQFRQQMQPAITPPRSFIFSCRIFVHGERNLSGAILASFQSRSSCYSCGAEFGRGRCAGLRRAAHGAGRCGAIGDRWRYGGAR